MEIVKVKILNTLAKMPTFGSDCAAGADLYAATDYDLIVRPGETLKIGTGLAMAIPTGYYGAIFARSGLATKQGLRPANCVGVIDSDYRGEIIVAMHNDSDIEQTVPAGSRIAQIIISPVPIIQYKEVTELSDTTRGSGGFGSTGVE